MKKKSKNQSYFDFKINNLKLIRVVINTIIQYTLELTPMHQINEYKKL